MANYTQIPYLPSTADLTDVAYANTDRLGFLGATWVRNTGTAPSSNTNLYRPGPSGNYWSREYTPVDFGMTSGRNAKETVLLATDFVGPSVTGAFYSSLSGSGAGVTGYTSTPDPSANPFGMLVVSTGVTATGSAVLGTHNAHYAANTTSRMAGEAVFSLPAASDSGQTFQAGIGFYPSLVTFDNFIGFRTETGTAIATVTNATATQGTPTTSLTLSVNTRYRARVEYFYSGGAYTTKMYLKVESAYTSTREWPWSPGDLIATYVNGTSGVTFPSSLPAFGVKVVKSVGTTARTMQVSQMIISTNF